MRPTTSLSQPRLRRPWRALVLLLMLTLGPVAVGGCGGGAGTPGSGMGADWERQQVTLRKMEEETEAAAEEAARDRSPKVAPSLPAPPQPSSASPSTLSPPPAPTPRVPVSTDPKPTPALAAPPATARVENSEVARRQRALAQLTQIGRAFETARQQSEGSYPDRRWPAKGKLSWRVGLLAYMGKPELLELLRKFRQDEPWDSPNNRPLLSQVPEVYQAAEAGAGKTRLVLMTGEGTAYPQADGSASSVCPDGWENTILLAEVSDARAVLWTAPDDYVFTSATIQQDLFDLHQDCCFALFGGGLGPRRIPANIADEPLWALLTPAGGEKLRAADVTRPPTTELDGKLRETLRARPLVRAVRPKAAGSTAAVSAPQNHAPSPESAPAVAGREARPAPAAPAANLTKDARPESASSDARWPVPDETALERAGDLWRDIFGDEAKHAKSATDKQALAQKMYRQSAGVGGEPAGKYVLLRAARDTAAQAGDVDTAFRAIADLATAFRVDPLPMQVKVLEQAGAAAEESHAWQSIFDQALRVGDRAVTQDAFADAQRAFTIAQSIARRENRREDLTRVYKKQEELQQARTAQQRLKKYALVLLQSPADPVANAAVGRYLCLVKGDWEHGLPRLIRGNDDRLRQLAQRELKPPATADERAEIADGWWDWATSTLPKLEQTQARQRAVYWYRHALPKMSGGLTKSRAEKRVAEIDEAHGSRLSGTR